MPVRKATTADRDALLTVYNDTVKTTAEFCVSGTPEWELENVDNVLAEYTVWAHTSRRIIDAFLCWTDKGRETPETSILCYSARLAQRSVADTCRDLIIAVFQDVLAAGHTALEGYDIKRHMVSRIPAVALMVAEKREASYKGISRTVDGDDYRWNVAQSLLNLGVTV